MEIIKDDELLENEFKTLVTQKMMLDTTNPTDFSFNGKAFNKFIKENKQNLNIVFKDNPQYLKDIDEFNSKYKIKEDKLSVQEKSKLSHSINLYLDVYLYIILFISIKVILIRAHIFTYIHYNI